MSEKTVFFVVELSVACLSRILQFGVRFCKTGAESEIEKYGRQHQRQIADVPIGAKTNRLATTRQTFPAKTLRLRFGPEVDEKRDRQKQKNGLPGVKPPI